MKIMIRFIHQELLWLYQTRLYIKRKDMKSPENLSKKTSSKFQDDVIIHKHLARVVYSLSKRHDARSPAAAK